MNYLRLTVKREKFSQEEDLSDKYNNQMFNRQPTSGVSTSSNNVLSNESTTSHRLSNASLRPQTVSDDSSSHFSGIAVGVTVAKERMSLSSHNSLTDMSFPTSKVTSYAPNRAKSLKAILAKEDLSSDTYLDAVANMAGGGNAENELISEDFTTSFNAPAAMTSLDAVPSVGVRV
ncbi:hypothetical protein Tco_1051708 [Tanacetum coccineum]